MRSKTNIAVVALTAAMTMGVGAVWAIPEVSGVTMVQRSYTRTMDITYTLSGEEGIVTLGIETNGVPLPDSVVTRLSGDVCKVVQPGSHSIEWNAGADWPENVAETARARVTAWSTNAPPLYMVIDLTSGAAGTAYPVSYYVSAAALPYGGLTNTVYKSTYLAMRQIPSGSFTMGDGAAAVAVNLSKNFYAGVFDVTQGQWYKVMGGTKQAYFYDAASQAFRPMENICYNDIRGTAAQGGGGWPTDSNVYASSFIGLLRAKAGGIAGFDLPTEAQCEYLCRAGTTTCFNDGNEAANVLGGNASTNQFLNALGRYKFDGGYPNGVNPPANSCSPTNGTAIVGSYAPNAWGLYDTHGNVFKWCLDWLGSSKTGGTDPKGPESGVNRVFRGGAWNYAASDCRSAALWYGDGPAQGYINRGFRLVRTLP